MAVDSEAGAGSGSGPSASPHPLLSAIKAVLDVGGEEEFAQELEEAALDAGRQLGSSQAYLSFTIRQKCDMGLVRLSVGDGALRTSFPVGACYYQAGAWAAGGEGFGRA